MQLGPMMRMPARCAICSSWSCRAAPSAPLSANCEVTINATLTPALAQSSNAASVSACGTTTTATSTGWPMALTLG